ncbi:class I SAM-dependent methyltransferase [Singulisphaera sp. PoT]|uniref:class I SAM-dependent methyltransferase n=1 Tax=Singulisphaera sp. PoT TaxID=3411797 RepID=UPI003BF493F8
MTGKTLMKSASDSPLSGVDRLARRIVTNQFASLQGGRILMHDATGMTSYGTSTDLSATLTVHDARLFRSAVTGGTLSVAESYLRGDWEADDLTSLFRIFARSRDSTNRLERGLARLTSLGHRLFHRFHANTRAGSRRNIEAHYDLGNDFYRLWLDETMAYSSGIFEMPDSTLKEASLEKFDRVCRKLNLQPPDEVLEIGTGWGGFALHAAREYGSRVTSTTISQAQFDLASGRIQDAGLKDRVEVLLEDYRDLRGQYDKLVSIEMIEAVGHKYLDSYFRQCGRLLRPNGTLVLQAIVMPESRYETYRKSVDFIQRYIFPGGCLPSVGAILESVGRTSDLRFVHAEDFAPHYAETLRRWRQNFWAHLDDVRRLGFSERFLRLWNYYLSYCEAAFEERLIGVMQLQFDKPGCRRDPLELGKLASKVC